MENSLLIDELNALRREKRLLESKVSELTSEMQTMRRSRKVPTPSGTRDSPAPAELARSRAGSMRGESPATTPALGSARPATQSGSGKLVRGNPLTWNEMVSSERNKVQGLLEQLDENNREIEGQRYEIKRLREQVQMLLTRAPVEEAGAQMQYNDNTRRSNTAPPPRANSSTPMGQRQGRP
ncbi:hypothetical protein T484DRAFT_2953649 [Baffinella frigidus]|nr:hypothetical protein T484DRAFT_2953649 [Cryptophyta sp. CCMP2293]